jgi:hypothetical protein
MEVNTTKTVVMPIGKTAVKDPVFSFRGKRVTIVQEFKYLGFIICDNGRWDTHVRKRILRGRQMIGATAKFLINRKIPNKVRHDVGRALVLSTTRYGQECTKVSAQLRASYESVQNSMNRTIMRLPRYAKAAAVRFVLGQPSMREADRHAQNRYHMRVLKLPESRLVRQTFTESPFSGDPSTSKKELALNLFSSRMERSVELLQDSHSRSAISAADGFLHPALEQSGRQYECLVQWIIGATDTYEDIRNMIKPTDHVTKICRLCDEPSSTETKSHLLLDCEKNRDLREAFVGKLSWDTINEFDKLNSEDEFAFILNSCTQSYRPVTKIQRVTKGHDIYDLSGLMCLRESLNFQSTQVFLHSRRTLEELPNSVAIEIRKENFVHRECVHITPQADEIERYSLALTRVLEIISNQDTQIIMDIRIVCSSKIFTHYLEEIHPSKGRRMVESKLLSAIQHINSANLQTHPFREALGLTYPRSVIGYVCNQSTHNADGALLEGENILQAKFKQRMRTTADFIYAVDKRLITRPHMSKFRNLHR